MSYTVLACHQTIDPDPPFRLVDQLSPQVTTGHTSIFLPYHIP